MPPPASGDSEHAGPLDRCIRDLAALNALPSMCIGRSAEEAMEILLDALPTALSCSLVYLSIPGISPERRALLNGSRVTEAELGALEAALSAPPDDRGAHVVPGAGKIWCFDAGVPLSSTSGRLLAGRSTPLHRQTDRVLVRSAANLVGTTLETARELDNAQRKDEFLAMLGHELRNPLAPILTAVEILNRKSQPSRELQIIDRQARHLARLVDDLLDISRATSGHMELRREQVSLDSVLEHAVELTAPLIARHRHTLHVAKAPDVTLQGDPVRLAQVFGNLLTNAAKFTPPGGQIDVSTELEAARVRVTVRDSGRGIARDQLSRIFEPFVQAEVERDAARGGLGLGLAIVKKLVLHHGGSIDAESDGPGQGARFVVELPTVSRTETIANEVVPQPTPARGGLRVLIVDDNLDAAELLSMALAAKGFETATVHDAKSALEKFRTFAPHAAILDVGLPDLDGYELARAVRAEYGAAPTLIAATGYGQKSDRERAAEAGFDRHFVKPVSVSELVRVIDER